jgi:hypothetical protein
MTTTRGSARYAGLLPVEPLDGPPPIRSTTLENDPLAKRPPPLRKRASRLSASFLIAFCIGVAVTLTWQPYGDEARQMIANSYAQLGRFSPRRALPVQEALDTIAAPAVSYPEQLDAILRDLKAMWQTLDRIIAGQEQLTRSIDEIATSIAARQAPTTRSTYRTAATITTGQGQMRRKTDQTTTSVDQAPSAKASSVTVESRDAAVSLQLTAPLNMKPTEAKPPQTSSERGKQLPSASGYDASCLPSASAVLQNHLGASPAWTLRARGHEGTLCWHVATQPSGSNHRPSAAAHQKEMIPKETETDGTTENRLFATPARYAMPPE